ncbi:carbohydrate ABC transporter permease, partial [Paenibacillus phytohabitans]
MKTSNKFSKILVYALLLIGVIISIAPFYWMIVGSTLTTGQIFSLPPKLSPGGFLAKNFASLKDSLGIARIFWNSIFIAIVYTVLS